MSRLAVTAALSALLFAPACTSGEGGEPGAGGAAPGSSTSLNGDVEEATTTTLRPADAKFCEEMLALDDRTADADANPTDALDAVDDVIDTYTKLLSIAPIEISEEFAAVLERVELARAGRALDEEKAAVAEDAATRVSAWVDLNCRGIANNPGPPPTPPS
jgi:hypothetical protein